MQYSLHAISNPCIYIYFYRSLFNSVMDILSIVISVFIFLETLNVLILYFTPASTKGNGIGVFKAYEKSKEIPEVHNLIRYLINWVAGTKIIFISLLIIILFTGNSTTILFSTIALILSISTFFWKLFPLLRMMDKENQITPKGYSRTLGYMIFTFILIFIIALIIFHLSK